MRFFIPKLYVPGIAVAVVVLLLFMFSIVKFWKGLGILDSELKADKASNSSFNESDKSSSDFSFSDRSPVDM